VRTFARELTEDTSGEGRPSAIFRAGETVVGTTVQASNGGAGARRTKGQAAGPGVARRAEDLATKGTGLGLTVLKKIVELYGGAIQMTRDKEEGSEYTVLFKAQRKE
jgi:nitrogen fixation/metabolism regulation signal transduction histidine kinase